MRDFEYRRSHFGEQCRSFVGCHFNNINRVKEASWSTDNRQLSVLVSDQGKWSRTQHSNLSSALGLNLFRFRFKFEFWNTVLCLQIDFLMCMPGSWPLGIRQSMWSGFTSTKIELRIARDLPSLCAFKLKISQVISMRQAIVCNCQAHPAYQIVLNESLQKMSVIWISLPYIYMGAAYTRSPCKQNNAMSICSLSEQQLWPRPFAHCATWCCLPVLYCIVKLL